MERIAKALQYADPLRRQMEIAAVIATEMKQHGVQCVLVGGSAVEFYTMASYLTQDIDMVVTVPDAIKTVMSGLGFINNGGTWVWSDDPSVIVEFPKGPLAGSWNKVQNVRLPDGAEVPVISIEDIIIDRLLAAKYWEDGSELWALRMIAAHYGDIDWKYCRQKAASEACLDYLQKYRDKARRERRRIFTKE